jgi:hypothetical protein
MFRKLNIFPSSGEGKQTSTLLGRVERANLSPFAWRWKHIQFSKICAPSIYNSGWWSKSINPEILSVVCIWYVMRRQALTYFEHKILIAIISLLSLLAIFSHQSFVTTRNTFGKNRNGILLTEAPRSTEVVKELKSYRQLKGEQGEMLWNK